MGFISKIFGAIFGFIGSLLSPIGKVFGLGGKSGYFVELDDSKPAAPSPQPAAAAPTQAKQSAKATESSAKPSAASAKTESKKVPAPVIEKPQAVSADIRHSNGSASMNSGKVIPGLTFAPEAILPVSANGGRRRPGPSLSPFKVMARDMQR